MYITHVLVAPKHLIKNLAHVLHLTMLQSAKQMQCQLGPRSPSRVAQHSSPSPFHSGGKVHHSMDLPSLSTTSTGAPFPVLNGNSAASARSSG